MPSLLRFYLNYYLRKALVSAFCFFPCIINSVGLFYYIDNNTVSYTLFVLLIFVSFLFFINGIVFFVRFNSLFFAARYCFVSGEYESYGKLFAFSLRCMDGKRREVFIKKLGFVPWFMCCVFLLPVSFVRSYYNLTMAQTAADIIQLQYLQKQ